MKIHFLARLATVSLALAALAACPHGADAATLSLTCSDPHVVEMERAGPKPGPVRRTFDVEVDTAAETMRVDGRVAQVKAMPDRFIWMGPLTRAGGLSHHDYVVVDRATNEARAGEVSPEGVAWGVVRYRCDVRTPPEGEADKPAK